MVTGAKDLAALGGVRCAQGGMFIRAHKMWCRPVCFSPCGEVVRGSLRIPAFRIRYADFGEFAFPRTRVNKPSAQARDPV